MRGRNCPAANSERFHAGERQHARDVATSDRVYRPVGAAMFSPSAKFTFQHDDHIVGRLAFTHDDFARDSATFNALGNKPQKIFARLILEDRDVTQFPEEFFGGSRQEALSHVCWALSVTRVI